MKGQIFSGWWQVLVCVLFQAVSTATISSAFSVIAVPIGQEFQPSRMVLMLPMTVTALVGGLLAPLLGTAMDRYSLRRLLLAGSALLICGYLALSFSTSMTQVLVIYGVLLATASVLLGPVAASTLLSRWFIKKRGLALGIAATGISLGGFFFPPIIQALIEAFEWRNAFRLLSLIIFVCTVPPILLLMSNRPADRNLHPDGDSDAPVLSAADRSEQFGSTGAILRDISFWLIALTIGLTLSSIKGLISNVMPLAIDLGVKADRAALLISVFAAGSFIGKLIFAALADRLELRVALATAVLVFALGMSSFWYASSYILLVCGGFLLGLAAGGILPLWGFLLARAFGAQNVGRVMGLMTFTVMPLTLFMPPFFGWVFDVTSSYDNAILISIGLALTTILVLPHIRTNPLPALAKPVAG